LQGCCQFLLLLARKQRTAHIYLMATITYPAGFSLLIPASNHRAHPPGCVAQLLSDHLWRFALLREPQNVPMRSLNRIFRLPVPLMQLFRCICCLDFNSLSHAS